MPLSPIGEGETVNATHFTSLICSVVALNQASRKAKSKPKTGDMEKYGANGALVRMEGFSSGGNSRLIYFGCEDCADEGARVVSAGGRVAREKMSIGEYGSIVLAVDTEGNMFGLHSMK